MSPTTDRGSSDVPEPDGARCDTITDTLSAEVADAHTLAGPMLSAMAEPTLRRLLILSDNRQVAAFQAGWMARRSQRHEMRHLLHVLLREAPTPHAR